jgi:hypothetical protein
MSVKYKDFLNKLNRAHEYERYISGMCPFVEHHNEAMLVFADGWFRCLGCGRHGSWEQLWNKLSGQQIVIRPEGKTAWKPPIVNEELCYQAHMDLIQFSSYQWYLEQRGLEGRIDVNELGYYEGWYTIPVKTADGDFITAVLRSAPHVQNTMGQRYMCRHVPVPFVPDHNLVHKSDYLFVVYGIFDALTLADLRFPVMTSTSGKDTFNPEWLNPWRKRIFIIPDLGEESTAYGLASQLDFRGKVINLEYPLHVKDCNGFYETGRGDLLRRQLLNVTL